MKSLVEDFMLRLYVLKQSILEDPDVKEMWQCTVFTGFVFSCIVVVIPIFATCISVLGFMLGLEN
jgi:hypothetical protein